MNEKRCAKCGEVKAIECFGRFVRAGYGVKYQPYCRSCRVSIEVMRKRANPEKTRASQKRAKLKMNYGITLEQREAQKDAQGGGCAICRRPLAGLSPQTVHVDHCHATGALRGVLCGPCNTGLGSFRDNPQLLEAAIRYLQAGGVWTTEVAA